MLIIRLLFMMVSLFVLLVMGLLAVFWMKVMLGKPSSMFFRNNYKYQSSKSPLDDEKVIQGEYKVLNDTPKE